MTDFTIPTSVKPEVVFVEELLADIRNGQLRIPRFQRPFVWEPRRMRNLFDSIYKSYPIGSLLIWDSPGELSSLDRLGPITIPKPSDKSISYVLDGHQRLTTLFCSLHLPPDVPLTKKQSDWQYWLFFNLESKEFVHVTDEKKMPAYFPLRSIIVTMDYLQECRRIERECKENAEELLKTADEMAQRLKSYKIPITRIKGGSPKEAVEIFTRLNSSGIEISEDQMFSALTYRENGAKSLTEYIDNILEEMADYGFGSIPRKQILQSILGAAGEDINMNEWEVIAKRLKPEMEIHIQKAKQGLLEASRFLFHDIGVPGSNYLPYVNQMLLFAAFFWTVRKDSPVFSDKCNMLKRWFWSTSLTGWFAGANPSQIRDMLKQMKDFAEDMNGKIQIPDGGTARPLPNRYTSRNAGIRCLMIYLFSLKPRYSDGSYIRPEDLSDEKSGFEYIFRGIENNLLSNPANRVLLPKKTGTPPVRKQILAVIQDLTVTQVHRSEFLRSHCIPETACIYIENSDAKSFIDMRKKHIIAEEAKFMRQFGVEPYEGDTDEDSEEALIDTE